jgi:ribosomal protein S18 acetylase RimI-like enzyme
VLRIEALAHRERPVAERIQAVMALAAAQEAQLLAGAESPPLLARPLAPSLSAYLALIARAVDEIAADSDFYLGAVKGDTLVGVLSVGPDDEAQQLCITVLAVQPATQRQGIARRLVQAALARLPGATFSVATTAGNAPALALYQALGFVAYRHGVIGPNSLPLVKLRRIAQAAASPASVG